MRDTFLWRLRAKECAWIDCDTKYEWISDMKQGVDSPYVYIIDHRRNDRVIARFRTPESFQKAIKKAESEATHPDLDPLDYSAEFGEQLNLVAREQLKVWSDK
jgi:hypothetical protein